MARYPHPLLTAALALCLSVPLPALGGSGHHDSKHHDRGHHDRGHDDHERATLEVDNQFDGSVDVYIDGQRKLELRGNSRGRVRVRSGKRTIEVRRPRTGYLLASNRVYLPRGGTVSLPIWAPQGALRFENQGGVPLQIEADGQRVWLQPGSSVQLSVTAGNVDVVSSQRDGRGAYLDVRRTLWVEPGIETAEVLRPVPTALSLTNHERMAVRVRIDGRDEGVLAPGEVRHVYVRPGSAQVQFVDYAGNTRLSTVVELCRGDDLPVVLSPPQYSGGPSARHAVAGRRPSARPVSYTTRRWR